MGELSEVLILCVAHGKVMDVVEEVSNVQRSKWCISSVQFSRSVVSDSLWPHELQHARPPCPSPTPGIHSNSRPLSQWCHPTISSSAIPFSYWLQSFPASGSFPMSWFFPSDGQIIGIGASASSSVLPMNIQGWFPLGLIQDLLAVLGIMSTLEGKCTAWKPSRVIFE